MLGADSLPPSSPPPPPPFFFFFFLPPSAAAAAGSAQFVAFWHSVTEPEGHMSGEAAEARPLGTQAVAGRATERMPALEARGRRARAVAAAYNPAAHEGGRGL